MALNYDRADDLRAVAVGELLGIAAFLRTKPQNSITHEWAARAIIAAADNYIAKREALEAEGQRQARQTTTPDYDRVDRTCR